MQRRLPPALAALLLLAAVSAHSSAAPAPYAGPIQQLGCDSQSLPESGAQGRVPKSEVDSGRSAKGYTCNTSLVSHFGKTGGFQVHRYVDKNGHVCAFYDSTGLFPKDAATNATEGLGVYAMDMSNPAHPVHTASLTTPAMLSPHESLRLNAKRGLLVADMGYPTTNPGFVDVYDVSQDCRQPVLDSSTPLGVLGHESAFSPDGTVFYVSSTGGHTLAAVDLTNPKVPSLLWFSVAYAAHGMSVSNDGNRLYIADTGLPGLTILDVSGINKHEMNPTVPVVSQLTWPEVSIPQNALPFTENGHKYLLEVDEYTNTTTAPSFNSVSVPPYDPTAKVGAARIIDIQNEKAPFVVSNIRLAVDQTPARAGDQRNDPGAQSPVQGYAAHYCALPTRVNPTFAACSFIVSGLRIFNIKDVHHPFQMGYYNAPSVPGMYPSDGDFAMSAPAFDLARHDVWYTDLYHGFFVVHLRTSVWAAGPLRAARVR